MPRSGSGLRNITTKQLTPIISPFPCHFVIPVEYREKMYHTKSNWVDCEVKHQIDTEAEPGNVVLEVDLT